MQNTDNSSQFGNNNQGALNPNNNQAPQQPIPNNLSQPQQANTQGFAQQPNFQPQQPQQANTQGFTQQTNSQPQQAQPTNIQFQSQTQPTNNQVPPQQQQNLNNFQQFVQQTIPGQHQQSQQFTQQGQSQFQQNRQLGNQQILNQNRVRQTRPVGQALGANPKRFILGCLGFIGIALILFVIFVIAFVSQNTVDGSNSLAATLGVNPGEFTNTLILITNLIFGLIVIITFFVTVFGLFRMGMAPKNDQVARKAGVKQALIAGAVFLVMVLIWAFVYVYLSGKKVDLPQTQLTGLITIPAETTRLTAPVDIVFDASKIPYDPNRFEITFYQWDFGDGNKSTSPIVTHTFTGIGQYNVTLIVTAHDKVTNENPTQTFNKLVTISNVKVKADFTATPESGPAPLTVSFDGSASTSPAGDIINYEWDFRGNNTYQDAKGKTTSYTFEKIGTYPVKLRVTDNSGQSDILTKQIEVGGPDIPTANINIPTQDGKYYLNQQLLFLGEKSTSPNGAVTKYQWDFGDGSPKSNTRTANHTYQKIGTYEVILTVTDEAGKVGSATQKINITIAELPPTAIITSTPEMDSKEKAIIGTMPFTVSFDASQSTDPNNNIVEYQWDFNGDGKPDANGMNTSYIFKESGNYNVTLTAIDSAGKQSSSNILVKVEAQGLVARLTADILEGNSPLTVTFDASSSSYDQGQIVSYEWDFGDGKPKRIDASKVAYKYNNIGTFTATVTAKASDGKTSTTSLDINVRPISLQSCFDPSVEQGQAPLTVEFDPRCTQGSVAKYLWDFGDGNTSRARKPTYTFDKPGSFQVTLEVTDNENIVNTFSKNILVKGDLN